MGRKKKSSLGKSIIRKKKQNRNKFREWAHRHSLADEETEEDRRQKNLHSIIETNNLAEFLEFTALENRDYKAEREVTLVVNDEPQTFELDDEKDEFVVSDMSDRQFKGDKDLRIPRRPPWTTTMSKHELHRREKETFLKWRRKLARLEEDFPGSILTPFEKNPEVWKQLWRVIERSHILVQIVDSRNPLVFRSKDLAKYVKEVDSDKHVILLVNKADLLTAEQRTVWGTYFDENNIDYIFFSARAEQEKVHNTQRQRDMSDVLAFDEIDLTSFQDPRKQDKIHIFSREELLWFFKSYLPSVKINQNATKYQSSDTPRVVVGFAGFPNVGKSSVINVLSGIKVVSVGSTPGKTKHFQTIPLGSSIMLCDSPGLVFPSITTTKANMVVDGVLPIDQLREHRAPVALLCKRIPRPIFEMIYGFKMPTQKVYVTVDMLLESFCRARGMMSHKGVPNGPAASRILLKDYVKGKLLFCHPPPGEFFENYEKIKKKYEQEKVEEKVDEKVEEVEEDGEEEWEDVDEESSDSEEYFTESDEEEEDEEERQERIAHSFNQYNANLPELEQRQIEKQNQKKKSKKKKRAKRDMANSQYFAFNMPTGEKSMHNLAELKRRVKNEQRDEEVSTGAHLQKKYAGKKRNQQLYQPKRTHSNIPIHVLKDLYKEEMKRQQEQQQPKQPSPSNQ